MVLFPNCKINLGLHILQKRNDGFHNLETIFYPLALQDGLEIIQNFSSYKTEAELTNTGFTISLEEDNICLKAYYLLKKDFPQIPAIKLHLHKTVPVGAGLGGGSADGAFTLCLLNKKFNLQLTKQQLLTYALQLGSDCPFFILNKPCYATGRGEKLEEIDLDLTSYKIILVNPQIHINTGWAFSQITPSPHRKSLKEIKNLPVSEWKKNMQNDFEELVFSKHPEIKKIREELLHQGAVYASMSGSGATVYGLFHKQAQPQFHYPSHYFIKSI